MMTRAYNGRSKRASKTAGAWAAGLAIVAAVLAGACEKQPPPRNARDTLQEREKSMVESMDKYEVKDPQPGAEGAGKDKGEAPAGKPAPTPEQKPSDPKPKPPG